MIVGKLPKQNPKTYTRTSGPRNMENREQHGTDQQGGQQQYTDATNQDT